MAAKPRAKADIPKHILDAIQHVWPDGMQDAVSWFLPEEQAAAKKRIPPKRGQQWQPAPRSSTPQAKAPVTSTQQVGFGTKRALRKAKGGILIAG
jgi:hypothetical protein